MRANEIMRSECGNYCHEDCPFLDDLSAVVRFKVRCTFEKPIDLEVDRSNHEVKISDSCRSKIGGTF